MPPETAVRAESLIQFILINGSNPNMVLQKENSIQTKIYNKFTEARFHIISPKIRLLKTETYPDNPYSNSEPDVTTTENMNEVTRRQIRGNNNCQPKHI